jgi:hypothetical protein
MSDISDYVRIYEIRFFLANTYSDVAHPLHCAAAVLKSSRVYPKSRERGRIILGEERPLVW